MARQESIKQKLYLYAVAPDLNGVNFGPIGLDGGTAHVVEELTLRNEGLVETRIVPVEPCI